MTYWLRIARAEIVREVTTALRYPVEIATGILLMFALFQGIFSGARSIAGDSMSGNLTGVQIGYCMWFLAILTINSLSVDLESEARQGTLEQVYIHSPSFTGLVWIRGLVHVALGMGPMIALALLIQATTHEWIQLSPSLILPVLTCVLVTVLGLCGWGLLLGGMALVFKRIGQLAGIVQFGLFLLAFSASADSTGAWGAIIRHGPFTAGIWQVNQMIATQHASWPALLLMGAESVAYAALGTLAFVALKKVALRGGMLSHY